MANYIANRRASTRPDAGRGSQTVRTPTQRGTPRTENRTRIDNSAFPRAVVRSVPVVTGYLFRHPVLRVSKPLIDHLIKMWLEAFFQWLYRPPLASPWVLRATGPQPPVLGFAGNSYAGAHPIWKTQVSQGLDGQAYIGDPYYEDATAKFDVYGSLAGGASEGNPRYYWYRYYDRTIATSPRPRRPRWLLDEDIDKQLKQPLRLPQFIPMDLPIRQPSAPVRPVPYPWIPHRKPDPMPEGSERGNDAPARDNPQWDPETPINYEPPFKPSPDHPVEIHLNPPRRPPEPQEKEKKFGGAGEGAVSFFRNISRFKEGVTELDDMLDAIHKAIDKKILDKLKKQRGKGYRPTPQSKAKDIYDNFDNIDWEKALDNMVENWAEDKVMGTAIRAGDLASKRLGLKSTLQGRGWMPRW